MFMRKFLFLLMFDNSLASHVSESEGIDNYILNLVEFMDFSCLSGWRLANMIEI